MNKNIKKFLSDSSNFRIVFFIEIFFFSVTFFKTVATIFNAFVFIWGIFILFKNFLINKKKPKYFYIICSFIFFNIITALIYIQHNFMANIVYILYMLIVFFVFYGMYTEKSYSQNNLEMIIVLKAIVILTTILGILSFITLFFPPNKPFYGRMIGLFDLRLNGIYTNSNLLGFSSIVGIIFSTILFSKKIFSKIFIIASILINLSCLILSDSNGSFLFLIIFCITVMFCKFLLPQKKLKISKIIIRSIFLIIASFVIIFSCFYFRMINQNIISNLINQSSNKINQSIDNNYSLSSPSNENVLPKFDDDYNKNSIGRRLGTDEYRDISSGRFGLIKQAMVLISKHPILGIGRGNLLYFSDIYFENGLNYSDLHNGYLTILVSSGIIGFILFFTFGILVTRLISKALFQQKIKDEFNVFILLFSTLVGYCVFILFEKTLFSEISFMSLFFWVILGYTINYVNHNKTTQEI